MIVANWQQGAKSVSGNRAETIPDAMQAIVISEPGGPQVLQLGDQAVPSPAAGEVLVRVSAAGVNRPDCLQRAGFYPPPAGASPLLGLEIAGHIIATGVDVDTQLVGQRVCALVSGGGYAPYCVARAEHCLPVPDELTMEEAAALPETLFTVWHNVFQRGAACDGETLLVHGGTSGIGTMATSLGKLLGLTVIVTCGTDAKCAAALANGADHALNYQTVDFAAEVGELTTSKGADVILDMVAGDYTQRNLDCLAINGRLVTIATLGGVMAKINMLTVMMKRQVLTGSTLRPRSNAFKAALADEIRREVWADVATGALRPVMDQSFALGEAAAAHARMEAGEHIGKIVLRIEHD